MIVKMIFGADLDDVPYEIERLLEDVVNRENINIIALQRALNDIRAHGKDAFVKQVPELQQLVGRSVKSIARIEDILGIIQGFNSASQITPEQLALLQEQPKEVPLKEETKIDPFSGNPNIEEFKDS